MLKKYAQKQFYKNNRKKSTSAAVQLRVFTLLPDKCAA